MHGGMVYQYDRNIFVLLDPDTVYPVHYTVYPSIFRNLYKQYLEINITISTSFNINHLQISVPANCMCSASY